MRILPILALLLVVSCDSIAAEDNVYTTLRVLQYNNAAEQYIGRQTAVSVLGKRGKQRLIVRFAKYGGSVYSSSGLGVMFLATSADEYLAFISKYRDWAAKATENGDAFTKEIGRAKSTPGLSLKFQFHSGNTTSHYLVIVVCSLGNCSVQEPIYLDEEGADELTSLVTKLKTGELPGT
ncbi:MAG: hypothetical protein U0989_16530 [Azonexus sp.]|nr:hypothetical protein [Azonexus sp.]